MTQTISVVQGNVLQLIPIGPNGREVSFNEYNRRTESQKERRDSFMVLIGGKKESGQKRMICPGEMMELLRQYGWILIATICVIFSICCFMTVFQKPASPAKHPKQVYASMEQEYVDQVRDALEEMGYQNSGINMNYVQTPDGVRSYVMTIHNNMMKSESVERQSKVLDRIGQITFADEGSNLTYEIN